MNFQESGGAGPTSSAPGSLSDAVADLTPKLVRLWNDCQGGAPSWGRTYSSADRAPREKALARFVRGVRDEARRPPLRPADVEAVRKRILSGFDRLAREAFDWEDRHLAALLTGGFDRAALEFTWMSRRFDAGLKPFAIYQAWRNVWVMNGIQMLLGLPVRVTPAVFAYSLLYPYTDNIIDDPGRDEEAKRAFNERFRRRLEGRNAAAADAQEQKIFDLVGLIEGQYDRPNSPQVYESLLSIHRAQVGSMLLLREKQPVAAAKVLPIVLEKGGTSVLADGCLVAGAVTPAQTEFLFGLGAFLQLVDDLEDVEEDVRDGLQTVFSRAAGREPLDSLTDRTACFGSRVMDGLGHFAVPGSEPLQELMRSAPLRALASSAAQARRFYTRPFLRALEAHSPFRFSFSDRQKRKLVRRQALLERLFEACTVLSPV